jgi:hypothetical protein
MPIRSHGRSRVLANDVPGNSASNTRRHRVSVLLWHSGHHVPQYLTFASGVSHTCPFSHLHRIGVRTLAYVWERHSPPRSAAAFVAAVRPRRYSSCAGRAWRLSALPQSGHQVPFRTLCREARHWWPSEHLQVTWARTGKFAVSRRAPPRFFATAAPSRRLLPRREIPTRALEQIGHHVPRLTTLSRRADHS